MIADPNEIQRLRFTPGQDLLARDFRDGETFATRLREWHNRALHAAFGVSLGLRVQQAGGAGGPLVAGPGLAYDAAGRELILREARTVVPPALDPGDPGKPLLAIRAACRGDVELSFSFDGRLHPCDGVPIARLEPTDAGYVLDAAFRPPAARPLARPRIGYGSTVLGGTAWQAEGVGKVDNAVALLIEIDTRAAGFTGTPCYFAWLEGRLLFPAEEDSLGRRPLVPLHLYPSLEEERQTGFRLRVLTLSARAGSQEVFRKWALATAQQSLALCWLGIQMPPETQSSSEVDHGNS